VHAQDTLRASVLTGDDERGEREAGEDGVESLPYRPDEAAPLALVGEAEDLVDGLDLVVATEVTMAMERVWTDIAIPNPCPNSSVSLCPAHESIHGHGCRSKSKSAGYPDIHGYPCP
jgi:hypothetical protein